MKVTVSVTRSNTLNERLGRYAERLARRTLAGMEAVGEYVKEKSLELVPRDTECLAETARVSVIGVGFDSVVVIGYGGKDFEFEERYSRHDHTLGGGGMVVKEPWKYAVYVHEDVDTLHENGGQSHFLLTPLLTEGAEMNAVFKAAAHTTL